MSLTDQVLAEYIKLDAINKQKVLDYILALQNTNNTGTIDQPSYEPISFNERDFGYIKGLSEETKQLFFHVLKNYNLNLYHSAAAIIQGSHGNSVESKYLYYMKKYSPKREYLRGNENKIKEIFEYVYKRLK